MHLTVKNRNRNVCLTLNGHLAASYLVSLWFNEKMNTEIEFSAQNYPPVNFCTKIGEGVVYMPGRFVVELPMYTD